MNYLTAAALLVACAATPLMAQTTTPAEPADPASPAQSEQSATPATPVKPDPVSADIAQKGIAATLADLKAKADPSPDDRFAVAGLEFLAALERVYQTRASFDMSFLSMLAFGSAGNISDMPEHQAAPMPPETIETLARDTLTSMEAVRAALDGLADGPEFGVAIAFDDLWFDLDKDGKRAEWEGARTLWDTAGLSTAYADPDETPAPLPVVRFDNADAAWLDAYSHLVSGGSELVLAFDPTPSIKRAFDTRALLVEKLGTLSEDERYDYANTFMDDWVDSVMITVDILGHQPDPEGTRRVKAHWLETIAQNRVFWKLVEAETDNAAEWIPNDAQVSATGVAFATGTKASWLNVLDDGEALLTGKISIPFWRAPIGIDVGAWLENPQPLPVEGVLQGWALAPFFTDAPIATEESLAAFSAVMAETDPLTAAIMIN